MIVNETASDWEKFLIEDAAVTRKAFAVWLSETYLRSPDGQALSRDIKRELCQILQPGYSLDRTALSAGTVEVLKVWESIPLVHGTRHIAPSTQIGPEVQGLPQHNIHEMGGRFPEQNQPGAARLPHTIQEQFLNDLDSDEPVVISSKTVVRAKPATKTEVEDADSDAGGAILADQPPRSVGSRVNFIGWKGDRDGRGRLQTPTDTVDLTDLASEVPQSSHHEAVDVNRPREKHDGSIRNSEDEDHPGARKDSHDDLLYVSEDEGDDFDTDVKMENIPWDWNSRYHPRFQQGIDHKPHGDSSDCQIIDEHMVGDNEAGDDREQDEHAGTGAASFRSSPPDGVGAERGVEAYDEVMEAEAGYAAIQYDTASGLAYGTNDNETADSEATIEIEDNDQADDAVSGTDVDCEADKENRRTSNGTNELLIALEGTDGRLEVRLVDEPSYSLSGDQYPSYQNMDVVDD
ncbi:MAG: hypothetical protein L6R40_006104 [Gallowayella cf. fulva]|nr:MAG: hypothetical protein L6R40_006104 [Xanthomendoza cf. fulva]